MKIPVVRVGGVGDTVMTTPSLSALIQYYPEAEIALLLSPTGKALLKDSHPNNIQAWTWQRSGIIRENVNASSVETVYDLEISFLDS